MTGSGGTIAEKIPATRPLGVMLILLKVWPEPIHGSVTAPLLMVIVVGELPVALAATRARMREPGGGLNEAVLTLVPLLLFATAGVDGSWVMFPLDGSISIQAIAAVLLAPKLLAPTLMISPLLFTAEVTKVLRASEWPESNMASIAVLPVAGVSAPVTPVSQTTE